MNLLKIAISLIMLAGLVACGGSSESNTEDAPAREPLAEETPVDETPSEEPLADETPTGEPLVEEIPTEEPPVEEPPAQNPPAEEEIADTGDFNNTVIDLFDFLLNDNLEIVGGVDQVLVTIFDGNTGEMLGPPFTQTMTRVDDETIITTRGDIETGVITLSDDTIEEMRADEDDELAMNSTDIRFVEIGETISMVVEVTEQESITTTCSVDEQFISFNISTATDGRISATPNAFSDVIRIRCEVSVDSFDPGVPNSQGVADNYYARGVGLIFFESTSTADSGVSFSLAATYERL